MTTAALLKRYAIVTAITLLALMVITYVAEIYFAFNIGSGTSIVAALVPALDAGTTYARTTKSMPETGYMWRMAALFVPINFAIGAVLLGIIGAALGGIPDIFALFIELGAITALIFAIVFVLYWLASRFFMGFGARNELKLQERLAAKKQP